MQLSPLQLEELRFVHVSIEPREEPDLKNFDEVFSPYEFSNTKFTSTVEHVAAQDEDDSPVSRIIVCLSIQLPDEGPSPPPYIIDIRCVGYFTISKVAFPDFTKRYDVGVVNGASLVYGAIREMIATVTARSWYGQMLLPAVNFQANAPSLGNHEVVEKNQPSPDTKKSKKRAATSKVS